ncbi:MAG: NADAR family protein [Pseudomonadota bacterium]
MTIYFYGQTDAYSEFSNFAPYGVEMEGAWWPTVEHYFQAQKFEYPAYRDKIRKANRPKDAKALGLTRKLPLRSDWEVVKEEIMYAAVAKKFMTHATLKELLLSTGDVAIIENAPMDYFWGAGQDGTGQNKLGKILMRVRSELSG